MKNIYKIFILLSLVLIILGSINIYVFGIDTIIKQGDNFISKGNKYTDTLDEGELKSASSTIYQVLLTIGIVVAIGVGGLIGIKMMVGSIEEKAEYKERLIPFVVGCIVVFGAFTIWSLVVETGNLALS